MNSYQKKKFTSLYTKFQQVLTLQGYSKTTYDNYSRGIRRLAAWCDRCPDQRLTQEDFKAYFHGRRRARGWGMRLRALIEHYSDRLAQHYGRALLPSHHKALDAMLACRRH